MRVAFGLFLIVFLTGSMLVGNIGPAWDEPDNIYAGFPSHFSGRIYTQNASPARYPPVPNYVGTILALAGERLGIVKTPHDIIVAFHLATLFFFALLVATVYRFARLLGLSQLVSIFAGVTAFLYPTLFGHGVSNLKDTAQVSLFTISLYFLVRGNVWAGGVVWGLALATKINAIYVPIIWGINGISPTSLKLRGVKGIVLIIFIGSLVTFAVWPYLWADPVGRGFEVFRYFTTVGQGYKAFFDGTLYTVGMGQSLWWYPWGNLLLVTPPLLIILGVIGVIREIRGKRPLLLVWLVVPMLRAFLPNAAFYDGIRHFMEILPAVILLAAAGLEKIGHLRHLRYLSYLSGGLVFLQLVFINVTLFPYSTGYLNILARDPNVRYDRDIEALSVREAMDYLHKTYGPVTVWSPIGGHLSWYYLGEQDRYVYGAKDADSIILVNKSSHIRQPEFDREIRATHALAFTVKRGDAVFGWIYRKKAAGY